MSSITASSTPHGGQLLPTTFKPACFPRASSDSSPCLTDSPPITRTHRLASWIVRIASRIHRLASRIHRFTNLSDILSNVMLDFSPSVRLSRGDTIHTIRDIKLGLLSLSASQPQCRFLLIVSPYSKCISGFANALSVTPNQWYFQLQDEVNLNPILGM